MFTAATWLQACARVTAEMRDYVKPLVTPISIFDTNMPQFGAAWGTGNYLAYGDLTYLITAEHVHSECQSREWIAHLPEPQGSYIALPRNPITSTWPVDAAAFQISSLTISAERNVIQQHLVAPRFQAVERELFFLLGFPGYNLNRNDPIHPDARKVSRFGELRLDGKPMLLQRAEGKVVSHGAFNPLHHVVLDYPASGNKVGEDGLVEFPNPKGLSGSLLWNTRFVETLGKGGPWSPECAQVCGLVIAALDDTQVILASKIEHIRAGLAGVFT